MYQNNQRQTDLNLSQPYLLAPPPSSKGEPSQFLRLPQQQQQQQPYVENKIEMSQMVEKAQDEKEIQEEEKKVTGRPVLQELLAIILVTFLEMVYIIGYICSSIARIFIYFYLLVVGRSSILNDLFDPILTIFFSLVKCYIIYFYLTQFNETNNDKMWLMNAFYLLLTQSLVLAYIKCVRYTNRPLLELIHYKNFLNKPNISNSFLQFCPEASNHVFDINNNPDVWKQEYKRIIEVYEVDLACQNFNTFFSLDENPSSYDWRGYSIFIDMHQQLSPQRVQFITIFCVSLLKIGFTLLYIVIKQYQFGEKEMYNLIILFFFYLNFCYSFNRILSNYDLRRKRQVLKNLNDMIKVSGSEYINYFEKLDVTNAISVETWDNCRRCVYDFFIDEQRKLEACYICLFFYYIFAAIACASYYAQFYIFFDKDSVHIQPLMVICYSMDFLFFSILLFQRIYQGQQYNDTFEKSGHRIDALHGLIQDLTQMYDYYFSKQYNTIQDLKQLIQEQIVVYNQLDGTLPIESTKIRESRKTEENDDDDNIEGMNTIYDVLVGKLKHTSSIYIQEKKEFLGKHYHPYTAKILQQKFMQNMLSSYSRIRDQIISDQKTHAYKFLKYFPVRFQETFFTILVGLATALPSILKKFSEIFV